MTAAVARQVRGALSLLGARGLRTRWVVRAPIWLYRAGLGCVFGSRLLMLEHRGRTTGKRRYVVLEVLDHPTRDTYVVVSGFGRRAQWYRNILAHPTVRVSSGLRRNTPATGQAMTDVQAAAALERYATRHPAAWANLRSTLEAAVGHPVDQLPMIILQLSGAT